MSASPIQQPTILGAPCWTRESVDGVIRPIAQVDPRRADWFLASHTPIKQLYDKRTGAVLKETDAFEALQSSTARELQVIVEGEPGTGKSHFINWLKLTYQHAAMTGGIENVLPVLIQRRSGSLKDALEQLVEQLPEQFSSYLDPVRAAISRISENQARERLCLYIKEALDAQWASVAVPKSCRQLKALGEIFVSKGFRTQLCRNGGVVAANIERLISPSDVGDRETDPEFTPEEFLIDDTPLRKQNTPEVMELIDNLDDETECRRYAAQLCNQVLRGAVREVTGLGNRQLTEIFRQIRIDLKPTHQRLVLFIEDVSTLSVLDEEIVNALEPQSDSRLCSLTSVLGMTSAAYKRLRDNQKQRASFIWSLGDDSNAAWFSESEELDRFVARYLNAVRLSAEDVRIVGRKRLEGSELSLSACEHCSLRPRCHETFGAVSFGEVEVGLFPLATSTAFRVMSKLDGARNVQKTQRSLLSSVLAPLLEEMHAREGNRVPALRLPALVDRPRYWTSFENTYVANWGSEEKRRALVLTAFWTQAEDEESAAKWLVSLAGPFGLPSLGKRIPKSPLPNPTPERAPPPAPPKNAPRPAGSNDKLQRLRNRLDPWLEGGELTMPKDAQDLLFSFIKNALPLAEARVPSRATHDLIKHSGIIRIEGGVTRQATVNFYIDFPRSPETHELIIALAHFEYEGGKSWTFAGAQIHKRSVATWLRRHQHAVMQNFDESRENAAAAVRTAARFLAMAATVVNRAALPRDAAEAIEQIINVAPTAAPHACSSRLKSLYEDLPKRCESVKEFLLAELDVPQGSGGILFIDTHVLIEQLSELQSTTLWEPLPDECFQGASLSRYVALLQYPEKTLWLGLPEAIADERIEIGRRLDKVVTQIALEVSDTSDLKKAFDEFATQAMSLRSSLNKARAGLLDSEFEALAKTLGIEKGKIASHLERAADVVSASDIKSVLSFDSARFEGDIRTINTIAEYVTRVRRFVSEALSVECSLEELSQVREVVVDKLKEFEGMLSHEC